jgi:acyl-CoA thioester hydrolase
MDSNDFKHRITVTVRFNEVDMLGVLNNAVYINFFEDARMQYIKMLGLIPDTGPFTDGIQYYMVRNEINYRGHAYYDEVLHIYSRIAYIKRSSFGFEHIVVKDKSKEIIADGSGVVVRVNPSTKKSEPLTGDFIERVTSVDKNVNILR